MAQQEGLYVATAGTYLNDRTALEEHYKSDLHRESPNTLVLVGVGWRPHGHILLAGTS